MITTRSRGRTLAGYLTAAALLGCGDHRPAESDTDGPTAKPTTGTVGTTATPTTGPAGTSELRGHAPVWGDQDTSTGQPRSQLCHDVGEARGLDAVGLAEDDQVGPAQLATQEASVIAVVSGSRELLDIEHREHRRVADDAAELETAERLGERPGIGFPARLDENVLRRRHSDDKTDERLDELAAQRAADAAAVQRLARAAGRVNLLALARGSVDVVQDGDAQAVAAAQEVVAQRGLAGAEGPADDRDRRG